MADTDSEMPAPAEHVWFSMAFLDVGAERRGQLEREHFSYFHDDHYAGGELERAGASYALFGACSARWFINDIWPFSTAWFKPRSHRENLVRAAALLIAAIERLDRAEAAGR